MIITPYLHANTYSNNTYEIAYYITYQLLFLNLTSFIKLSFIVCNLFYITHSFQALSHARTLVRADSLESLDSVDSNHSQQSKKSSRAVSRSNSRQGSAMQRSRYG